MTASVSTTILMAGLVVASAGGLLAWGWFAMTGIEEKLRVLEFEGMHFGI